MTDVPRIVGQRLQAAAKAEVHPEPNLLNAFVEKSLGGRERLDVLTHLSQCADCRDVIALASGERESAGAASPAGLGRGWLAWPILRWGALAACVVVVAAAVTLRYTKREGIATFSDAMRPASTTDEKVSRQLQVSQPRDEIKAASEAVSANKEALKGELEAKRDRDLTINAPVRARRAEPPAAARENYAAKQPASMDSLSRRPQAEGTKIASAAPVPPPFSKTADSAQQYKSSKDSFAVSAKPNNNEVAAATESVTVSSENEPVTGGKVKQEEDSQSSQDLRSSNELSGSRAVPGIAPGSSPALAGGSAATPQALHSARLRADKKLIARWTLSADGSLQRSFDLGTTWETVPVAGKAVFRALAAVGSDVWVGGAGGVLYHSSDVGQRWTQVRPSVDGKFLSADIIGVEFADTLHGKITTAGQQTWVTSDGGLTWQNK